MGKRKIIEAAKKKGLTVVSADWETRFSQDSPIPSGHSSLGLRLILFMVSLNIRRSPTPLRHWSGSIA